MGLGDVLGSALSSGLSGVFGGGLAGQLAGKLGNALGEELGGDLESGAGSFLKDMLDKGDQGEASSFKLEDQYAAGKGGGGGKTAFNIIEGEPLQQYAAGKGGGGGKGGYAPDEEDGAISNELA